LAILIVSFSVAYYFLIFLPKNSRIAEKSAISELSAEDLVEKDYTNLMNLRTTGNCDAFADYIYNDSEKDKWRKQCIDEKDFIKDPIVDFKVLRTTTSGEKAYLQAELKRDDGEGGYKYPFSYDFIKQDDKWKITSKIDIEY
jgi:hypothetical protein